MQKITSSAADSRRATRFWLCGALAVVFVASGLAQTATITTYAGLPVPPDGTPAKSIGISPVSVVPDEFGGFYFTSDFGIFHVGTNGTTQLIATATNGQNPAATFLGPGAITRDSLGNLYVAASNRIWKITSTGVISAVAGTGTQGFSGDGGPALAAQFVVIGNLSFDAAGNLYVADVADHRIRRIDTAGIVSTIAGNGTAGFSGDNGPATDAQLNRPAGITFDRRGNSYVADTSNHRVRKISASGVITTIAGNGGMTYNGDNIPATDAAVLGPQSVAVDFAGNLLIGQLYRVRKVTPDGTISTVAGNGLLQHDTREGIPATLISMLPRNIALDGSGNLYIAESSFIRQVTLDGIAHNLAGNGTFRLSGDGGPAVAAQITSTFALATDGSENLYLADWSNGRLRKVDVAGMISSLNSTSIQAAGLAVDAGGSIYFSRSGQHVIYRMSPGGLATVVAGSATGGFSGDGGPATLATLSNPSGVALDLAGNLYIGDVSNRRIRKVSSGVITTLVSNVDPDGLSTDEAGNVYFASSKDSSVYRVTSDGSLSRVAGNLIKGFSGDGGPAVLAQLNGPWDVVVDRTGNLFIADRINNRVRKVDPAGIISTIAGTGTAGYTGDGGPALAARLSPRALALDIRGNLYVADGSIDVVRKIDRVASPLLGFALSGTNMAFSGTQGVGSNGSLVSGSVRIQSDNGSAPPAGLAIFSVRQNGILVSEGTVPAVQPFRSGRLYAEIDRGVNTGVAFANVSGEAASVRFALTTNAGDLREGIFSIPAGGQIAAFLDQLPFGGPAGFRGTFSFDSNVPVGVIGLRGVLNERGEFITTTLPVVDLADAVSFTPFTLPHFADGGGWTSQVVLVNPGTSPLAGTLAFFDPAGNPVALTIEGQTRTTFAYSLPAAGHQRFVTSGNSAVAQVGSVVVTPDLDVAAPSGLVIFSFRKNGVMVTETGVPSLAQGTVFRVYAEAEGSLQSGVALANSSNTTALVILSLFHLDGRSAGSPAFLSIPPHGQASKFLNEIQGFSGISSFQGILRIFSMVPISAMGLRTRYNERGDFLITTTTPINEGSTVPSEVVFPHFADGGGYSTQFILYSRNLGQRTTGLLRFSSPPGQALRLPMR